MQTEREVPVFGKDFDAFVSFLRVSETSAVISPARYGYALCLDVQSLAKCVGIHRNTAARARESVKLQGFLRDSLRVSAAVVN